MGDVGFTSGVYGTFQHPYPFRFSTVSRNVLHGLPKVDGNISTVSPSLSTALAFNTAFYDFSCLYRDLLWQPQLLVVKLLTLVWRNIATSPPLLKLIIVSLLLRYVVYDALLWVVTDYQKYLDLGRGGSPSDFWGWWRVTRLKYMAAIEVLEPPHVPPMLEPYRGILWNFPTRKGPRPRVQGIAPQRQIDQKTPVSTFDTLLDMISRFAKAHPKDLIVETSFLEGHTTALKANKFSSSSSSFSSSSRLGVPDTEGEYGFEICHPHRNDGSLHMVLHPEDIRTVIEAGWGERHPLATNKWYWRWWYHSIRRQRKPIPEYLVLIYAPRNEKELGQVYRLLKAAVWFATNKWLDDDEEEEEEEEEEQKLHR